MKDSVIAGPTPTSSTTVPFQTPLRPELFVPTKPAKTNRRTPRNIRQRAERPDPMMLDIPVDEGPQYELPVDLRDRLTTAALIARPVFTSDLLSLAGSADAVAAWESDLRADPAGSPVRFLAAKGRHRLRGSLVVPVNRNTGQNGRLDWWGECVERYRGARLYELGVLLHRIGEEVITAEHDPDALLLRLNTNRGIVGVIVLFDTPSQSNPTAVTLERMLGQLLGERCSLVAVLTTLGESPALAQLGEHIGSLAITKGWRPAFPVITARSWEFADDRGTTAQLVLGG